MVLQVLTDAGQVMDRVDPHRSQMVGVTDAGQLEQLGGVEGATGQDHLTGGDGTGDATGGVLDTDGAGSFEPDAVHMGAGDDIQVGPAHHRVQIGPGGAEAAAPMDVAVEAGKTLLLETVDVLGEGISGLRGRLEEGAEQGVGGGSPFNHQRPFTTAELVGPGQAGLHPLEVGETVGEVPGLHAGVGSPSLEVHRVAPLEDHPVDRRRSAQHLAAGVIDLAAIHERFGLGLVLPVVEAAADRERQCRRHVYEHVPAVVGSPRLQHQHPVGRVGGQPVGERGTGGTAADDDEVVGSRRHHREVSWREKAGAPQNARAGTT